MSTALAPEPTLETRPIAGDLPQSHRRRIAVGAVLFALGVICALGWGVGSGNTDAKFNFTAGVSGSPTLVQFDGEAVCLGIGALICVLGAWHAVRGWSKPVMRWVLAGSIALFVIGFLIWATTGPTGLAISVPGLIGSSIVAAVPFILGALAGIVCERSGVINVAIEGQMLVGAFAGALFASAFSSLGVGVVAACIGGLLIGALLAVFAIRYLVNQVVLGVVLNTLALGLTNLGYHAIMAGDQQSQQYNAGLILSPIRIPGLADIPVIGQPLFDQNAIVYATYGLIVAVHFALFRTRWGLRTRAVGEHPKAADTVGIRVKGTRWRNVLIGGLIAGLAGASLTVGGSGQFTPNISSGKGFIALAAVIFGRWSPGGAVAAALLFGFTNQLQTQLTIMIPPVAIPSAFLSMAPYIVTVVAVAGLVGRVQAPAADGEPYVSQ